MIRSHNRFVLAAALGAAILFPIGCASSHRDVNTGTNNTNSPNFAPGTTSDTTSMSSSTSTSTSSPAVSGTSTQTATSNTTYVTPATNLNTQTTSPQSNTVTNPDGSTTTTTTNADGSTTTVTRSASGALISSSNTTTSQTVYPRSTIVTNADGSTTTTTYNADGSTTMVTRNANGTIISSGNPTSSQSTTTNVTTGNATTGTTKVTTTTTTTFYGQPGFVNGVPATATATVNTPPPTYVQQPAMASSTQTDIYPTYGFGRSRNHGRSVDLNLFADWADFTNASRTGGGLPGTVATGPLGTSFKNANGYGASLNMFFAPTLSVEFGASRITPSATFIPSVAGVPTFTGTKVRMTPITGTLQWHFLANHSFDPYIGLGGAYVMFNSTSNIVNSGGTGFESVGFSDRGGPLANAGVSIGFGRSVGLIFDAKYIRLRGNGTTNFGTGAGVTPTAATFDLNPLILSGGIRFGF